MKTLLSTIAAGALLATTFAAPAAKATDAEASVKSAFSVCYVMDNNFPLSAPCEVSGWHSAVQVSMAISVAEARAACRIVTAAASEAGLEFDSGWKLEIRSPYSGDSTIAVCPFL